MTETANKPVTSDFFLFVNLINHQMSTVFFVSASRQMLLYVFLFFRKQRYNKSDKRTDEYAHEKSVFKPDTSSITYKISYEDA